MQRTLRGICLLFVAALLPVASASRPRAKRFLGFTTHFVNSFKLCTKAQAVLKKNAPGFLWDEAYFQKTLRYAPIAVFRARADGTVFYGNRKWEELTGAIPEREATGAIPGSFPDISQADVDQMLAGIREAAAAGRENTSCVLHFTSGEPRSLQVDLRLDLDGNGAAVSFTGFACLQTPADHRTRDFHALISSLEDIILEIDYHQVFRNVWTRDHASLFLPPEAFLGKTVTEAFGPAAPLFVQVIEEVIRTGQPKEFIYPGLHRFSGNWYRAKARPLASEALAGEPSLVVVIQEYTETRTYWEALEQAKRDLEQGKRLLDTSERLSLSSGWELDVRTGEMTLTDQAYHIYGIPRGVPVNRKMLSRCYDPAEWKRLLAAAQASILSGEPFDIELQITTLAGARKWVRVIGMPVFEESELSAMVGAMMDISHKKNIEKELIEAKTLAETAAREKADFLSVMSHEIRTPLNSIIGLANLLKLEHLPGNAEYVENLVFSSNHLLQLINDILSLHKIEGGKFEKHLENTRLRALLENIRNQFVPLAAEKGIRLVFGVDPAVPEWLMADPTLITQVLNNLLSNAVKFTEQGSVTLSVRLKEAQAETAILGFSVADTGMGIPEALQEEIFEQFKQLRHGSSGKYAGTGLGLTITRKLIESQGSRIHVASAAGKGAEFYFDLRFSLPGGVSTPAASPVSPEAYKDRLSHLKVLVIEDNPVNRALTGHQLRYFGIRPDFAAQGTEALEWLESRSYDMLLLDLHMPGPDGFALVGIIRSRYPDARIVIFTADPSAEEDPRLNVADITGILKKPFLPPELLAMLLKCLPAGQRPEA